MTGQIDLLHALSQPMNVIRLTVANIGMRMLPRLEEDDQAYLADRLAIIEAQIKQFVFIMEQLDSGIITEDAPQQPGAAQDLDS